MRTVVVSLFYVKNYIQSTFLLLLFTFKLIPDYLYNACIKLIILNHRE